MKPILINNLEVAKSQERLTGEMTAQDSERLAEAVDPLHQGKLKVQYSLTGDDAKTHSPSMRLTIKALLPLVCQRCLEAMQFDVALTFDYVVSAVEPEEADGDDDVDWVEASGTMDLTELIEDELLIAIPLSPRHEIDCQPLKMESGDKPNPFAVLKGLVK